MRNGLEAYQAAMTYRSEKAREAELFARTNAALRSSASGSPTRRVRALADNRLLWNTVCDLMHDPANALPVSLRAAIVSLGLAVRREMDKDEPNIDFLISINHEIGAGLAGG